MRFLDEVISGVIRSMNRWSGYNLTRQYMFRDVRKIRNVPVCGDTIADLRGAAPVTEEGGEE